MNDEIQILDTDTPVEETTTYTPYERINFENGKLVKPGIVDLETGELTMPVYSGKAPINAQNLNHIEDGIKNLEEYILTNGGGGGGSEPIGTVKVYAGTAIPDGYLLCDGRQISKTEYGELFAILGTTFNLTSDTDSTKFRIPDLRGRVVVGVGSFDTTHTFTLAKKGGEYEHKLTIDEMPSHQHKAYCSDNTGTAWNMANSGTGSNRSYDGYIAPTGGEKSHNNIQPYIALNYIIKAVKTTSLIAEVEDSLESNSTNNAPSTHAVNQIKHENLVTNGSPVKCGYKVDGKDVYVIRVEFDAPTSSNNLVVSKEINILISNIKVLSLEGTLYAKNGENYIALPDPGSIGANNPIRLNVNKGSNGKANVSAIFEQPRNDYAIEVNVYFVYK